MLIAGTTNKSGNWRRSPSAAFERVMGRRPGKVNPFGLEPQRTAKPLPAAALYHYWNPDREGVEHAPKDFLRQLALVHADLACVRAPMNVPAPCDSRWMVWVKKPEVRYWLCPGWNLLFLWPPKEYAPIPLDNRIFANLAIIDSRKYGTALQYFDTIVEDLKQTKARQAKSANEYREDRKRDYWDATKIKNIGHGSKFALHHDGTVAPGRGEQNWLRERGAYLPDDVVQRDAAETKQRSRRVMIEGADAHAMDRAITSLRVQAQLEALARVKQREKVAVLAQHQRRFV